jgi:predicted negative regulator of RcsB-dependent stress response
MASHLDLEEQEQLAELKHFWSTYGNLISWLLIVVLGAYAAWNGWQYWGRHQAAQASALYDEVERSLSSKDLARIERSASDMKDKFGSTQFAHQAGLQAAQSLAAEGKSEQAMAWLAWVSDKAPDTALRELARIRLAALQWENQHANDALKTLETAFSADMQALAADLKGDILLSLGRSSDAVTAYRQALQGLGVSDYARIVQAKLAVLGSDAEVKP